MTPRACATCDGTGCPCFRARDWQSIDQGCDEGCPECGLNTCRSTTSPSTTDRLSVAPATEQKKEADPSAS